MSPSGKAMDFDSIIRRFESSHPSFYSFAIIIYMNAYIEFIDEKPESSLPIIKLTKSKNGKTGTATFIFIYPSIFNMTSLSLTHLEGMNLKWKDNSLKRVSCIRTNDVNIIFRKGKPFLVKGIFILKNSHEWFQFLNFMTCYSKETGLYFSESNSRNTIDI